MRMQPVAKGLVGDFIVAIIMLIALVQVMVMRCFLKPFVRNDPNALLAYELREMIMLDIYHNGLPRE